VPIDLSFPLRATSALISSGWRIRLSLAGADFPIVWPPGQRFTLTVDPSHSALTLPVISPGAKDRPVEIPMAGQIPPAPTESLRDVSEWGVMASDGAHTLRRLRGSTDHLPDRGGLTCESDQWWAVTVDDDRPTMSLRTESSVSLSRPGWSVTTEGSIEIRGGPVFETTVELVAHHDGEEVFQRRWSEEIARVWV
jgi:hypothetical protein